MSSSASANTHPSAGIKQSLFTMRIVLNSGRVGGRVEQDTIPSPAAFLLWTHWDALGHITNHPTHPTHKSTFVHTVSPAGLEVAPI